MRLNQEKRARVVNAAMERFDEPGREKRKEAEILATNAAIFRLLARRTSNHETHALREKAVAQWVDKVRAMAREAHIDQYVIAKPHELSYFHIHYLAKGSEMPSLISLDLPDKTCVPVSDRILEFDQTDDTPVGQRVNELMDKRRDLKKELNAIPKEAQALREELWARLRQFSTVESLVDAWPEVNELCPGLGSGTGLVASPRELNEAIGIKSKE